MCAARAISCGLCNLLPRIIVSQFCCLLFAVKVIFCVLTFFRNLGLRQAVRTEVVSTCWKLLRAILMLMTTAYQNEYRGREGCPTVGMFVV